MNREILVLANVSGFLNKFEVENIKLMKKLGYHVHYATNFNEQCYAYDEDVIINLGIQIHHIDIERSPYNIRGNIKALNQLIDIVRENNIEFIHCHTPVGGVLGRLAGKMCRRENVRVIYTAHGLHFYKGAPLKNNTLYYLAEKALAPLTDVMIVINSEDYDRAKKLRLKEDGQLHKIPGVGLDLEKFSPLTIAEKNEKRMQLGIKQDDFFLLSVGELNENKNHKIVLHALAKMKKEYPHMNIKYGICGSGFLKDTIPVWIKEMGLEDSVILFGYKKNIVDILGCADGSVFPTKREGLGMAALESLAMGVPVIASNNRGTREYIIHRENGYMCRCDDADDFIQGIEYMYYMDETRRADMAIYCRESVRAFDKKYTNEIMERVYRDVGEIMGDEVYV